MGAETSTLFVGVIELSENSMLLFPQGWLQWHHFVPCFTQRMVDVG